MVWVANRWHRDKTPSKCLTAIVKGQPALCLICYSKSRAFWINRWQCSCNCHFSTDLIFVLATLDRRWLKIQEIWAFKYSHTRLCSFVLHVYRYEVTPICTPSANQGSYLSIGTSKRQASVICGDFHAFVMFRFYIYGAIGTKSIGVAPMVERGLLCYIS